MLRGREDLVAGGHLSDNLQVRLERQEGGERAADHVVRGGRLAIGGAEVPVCGPDGPATFTIRPEHAVLGDTAPLAATVVEAVYAGTHVRVVLRAGEQRPEVHAVGGQVPPAGARVGVALPPERLWRLPARSPAPAAPARPAGRP